MFQYVPGCGWLGMTWVNNVSWPGFLGAGSLDFWVEILRGLVREMDSGGNNVRSKGALRLMIRAV